MRPKIWDCFGLPFLDLRFPVSSSLLAGHVEWLGVSRRLLQRHQPGRTKFRIEGALSYGEMVECLILAMGVITRYTPEECGAGSDILLLLEPPFLALRICYVFDTAHIRV